MLIKIIAIILFLLMLYLLGSAAVLMMRGNAASKKMAKALTWRVVVSLLLFCLLIAGYYAGWIKPRPLPIRPQALKKL